MVRTRLAASVSYEYDVFISYSHRDDDWVHQTLLPRLERAGLRVCIDIRDFTPGKMAKSNMRDAVKRSRRTAVVLTKGWVSSEWATYEGAVGRRLDPSASARRVIPLLLETCTPPENISQLSWIDFTRPDRENRAWHQLLVALEASPEALAVESPPAVGNWFLAHPYPMPPNFTGRAAERAMLTRWLTADATHPLLVLRALGGFGKSSLAWQWLRRDVVASEFPRVVWWSFYERDATFASFVAETLRYLTGGRIDPSSMPARGQLDALLRELRPAGTLLVLDGFERELRAFAGLDAAYQGDEMAGGGGERGTPRGDCDCQSLIAEMFLRAVATLPGLGAKVLLTTRLRPSPVGTRGGVLLEGCREETLLQLEPADAIELLRAYGIREGRTELDAACAAYGYHPLSLRLLAGLIVSDLQEPGDIVAARRLDVSGDLVQRQHHVLKEAYESLGRARQTLLSKIACFRGPMSYDALVSLSGNKRSGARVAGGGTRPDGSAIDADLRDLVARGLLHQDVKARSFDLHPIVRRYAYDRLAASGRADTHTRLRNYFAAVPMPPTVRDLNDLTPVIELYHHTVRAGRYDDACDLFYHHLQEPTSTQFIAHQLRSDLLRSLFPDGEEHPPLLTKKTDRGWALNALAESYAHIGQPHRAISLPERSCEMYSRQDSRDNLAAIFTKVARLKRATGALRQSEADLERALRLVPRKLDARLLGILFEAAELSLVRGDATIDFDEAIKLLDENVDDVNWQFILHFGRARLDLLRWRYATASSSLVSDAPNISTSLEAASRTLEVLHASGLTGTSHSSEALLLSAAYRAGGHAAQAEGLLHDALDRCRQTNDLMKESDVLVELARVQLAIGSFDDAQRSAEEALAITERSGCVLGGADARLVLARLAHARGERVACREHATEALRLATCNDAPDYTYKVACQEADALLKAVGQASATGC